MAIVMDLNGFARNADSPSGICEWNLRGIDCNTQVDHIHILIHVLQSNCSQPKSFIYSAFFLQGLSGCLLSTAAMVAFRWWSISRRAVATATWKRIAGVKQGRPRPSGLNSVGPRCGLVYCSRVWQCLSAWRCLSVYRMSIGVEWGTGNMEEGLYR